jgi:hypothetical protein
MVSSEPHVGRVVGHQFPEATVTPAASDVSAAMLVALAFDRRGSGHLWRFEFLEQRRIGLGLGLGRRCGAVEESKRNVAATLLRESVGQLVGCNRKLRNLPAGTRRSQTQRHRLKVEAHDRIEARRRRGGCRHNAMSRFAAAPCSAFSVAAATAMRTPSTAHNVERDARFNHFLKRFRLGAVAHDDRQLRAFVDEIRGSVAAAASRRAASLAASRRAASLAAAAATATALGVLAPKLGANRKCLGHRGAQ